MKLKLIWSVYFVAIMALIIVSAYKWSDGWENVSASLTGVVLFLGLTGAVIFLDQIANLRAFRCFIPAPLMALVAACADVPVALQAGIFFVTLVPCAYSLYCYKKTIEVKNSFSLRQKLGLILLTICAFAIVFAFTLYQYKFNEIVTLIMG